MGYRNFRDFVAVAEQQGVARAALRGARAVREPAIHDG